MSNFSFTPWSDKPNAPKVSHPEHREEKALLAGSLIDMVFFGIIFALSIQCMTVLFDSAKQNQRGIRWLFVVHTVAVFSFATLAPATSFCLAVIFFVKDREFPSGPSYYLHHVAVDDLSLVVASRVPQVTLGWLADGLLLYRCCVLYARNLCVIAFPCLVYLASVGVGIVYLCEHLFPHSTFWGDISALNFGVLYLAISISLNTILTLMITIRLALHNRMVLRSIGAQGGANGLYQFIIAVVVESCALYTVSVIILLGVWVPESYLTNCLSALVDGTQVIAPLLITLRIANRTALTGNSVTGSASSIEFRSQDGTAGGDGTDPGEKPVGSMDGQGDTSDGGGTGAENFIEEVPR